MKQIMNGVARRIASAPLGLLPFSTRARAIEALTEQMIASAMTGAGPIQFLCPTPLLAKRAEMLLSKEPEMIRWIDGFAPSSVFWDIGANIGAFSLYAGMRRDVSVLAFEPAAANYYVLSRNIQLNGLSDHIVAHCVALAGKTELGVLNMVSAAMGASVSQFGRPGEMSRFAEDGVENVIHGMVAYRIDDFIKQFAPAFPNYIKMDVDGLEWAILQGAVKTVHDPRLSSLMVELTMSDNAEQRDAIKFLEDAGFQLVDRGEMQGFGKEQAANHLFQRVR